MLMTFRNRSVKDETSIMRFKRRKKEKERRKRRNLSYRTMKNFATRKFAFNSQIIYNYVKYKKKIAMIIGRLPILQHHTSIFTYS